MTVQGNPGICRMPPALSVRLFEAGPAKCRAQCGFCLTIVDLGVSYFSPSRATPTYPHCRLGRSSGSVSVLSNKRKKVPTRSQPRGEVLKLREFDSGTYAVSRLLEQLGGELLQTGASRDSLSPGRFFSFEATGES